MKWMILRQKKLFQLEVNVGTLKLKNGERTRPTVTVRGFVEFVIKNLPVSCHIKNSISLQLTVYILDVRRYNRHTKIHDDDKQYRCPKCNKGFNERADLNRHIERHIKSNQVVAQEENFNCPECHMSFKVQSDLKIHQSVHRNDGKIIC